MTQVTRTAPHEPAPLSETPLLPFSTGSSRYVVAEAGEIPPGGRKTVDLDGISVGVFHVNGEYFALLNWCPHQAARLCEGKLWSALEANVPGDYQTSRDGEILACPWHGWEFDLRTGQSRCEPERLRVRAYDVRIEPSTLVAQTYSVAREGNYIVVDLSRTAAGVSV